MDIVIYEKFSQHEDIKRELLETGDAKLVEVSICVAFFDG
jgi:predicted NAD-dependent protein-ADP-ribosyltransferase YbiA (DUF1768 family)